MLKLIIMQQIINARYYVMVNKKFQPMNALLGSTGSTPKAVLFATSKGPVKSEEIIRIQLFLSFLVLI